MDKHSDIRLLWRKFRNRKGRTGNIVMFHTARCGSTVLGDLLNRHPDIIWAGEIFNRNVSRYIKPDWKTDPIRKTIEWQVYRSRTSYFGFETTIMPSQQLRPGCIGMTIDDYVKLLHDTGISHFIILKRENYLRRAVSAQIARERDKYHQKHDETKQLYSTFIDQDHFQVGSEFMPLMDAFRLMDERYEILNRALTGKTKLDISYERHIQDDPHIAYEMVCRFLGLEPVPAETVYHRTNPFPLKDIIVNFKEVEDHLSGTPYEWMIKE